MDENMRHLQMPSAQSLSVADGALPVRMGVERMILIGRNQTRRQPEAVN